MSWGASAGLLYCSFASDEEVRVLSATKNGFHVISVENFETVFSKGFEQLTYIFLRQY